MSLSKSTADQPSKTLIVPFFKRKYNLKTTTLVPEHYVVSGTVYARGVNLGGPFIRNWEGGQIPIGECEGELTATLYPDGHVSIMKPGRVMLLQPKGDAQMQHSLFPNSETHTAELVGECGMHCTKSGSVLLVGDSDGALGLVCFMMGKIPAESLCASLYQSKLGMLNTVWPRRAEANPLPSPVVVVAQEPDPLVKSVLEAVQPKGDVARLSSVISGLQGHLQRLVSVKVEEENAAKRPLDEASGAKRAKNE